MSKPTNRRRRVLVTVGEDDYEALKREARIQNQAAKEYGWHQDRPNTWKDAVQSAFNEGMADMAVRHSEDDACERATADDD